MKKEEETNNFDFEKRTQFEFDFEKDKGITSQHQNKARKFSFSLIAFAAVIFVSFVALFITSYNQSDIVENGNCETSLTSVKEPFSKKASPVVASVFPASSLQDSLDSSAPHSEETVPTDTTITESNYNIEATARSVIHGNFGNGQERRQRLGCKYSDVQRRVNEILRNNQQAASPNASHP